MEILMPPMPAERMLIRSQPMCGSLPVGQGFPGA